MKLSQGVKQSTQLTLTKEMREAISLLQLNAVELQKEIQHYIDSNPLLEAEEDEISPVEVMPGVTAQMVKSAPSDFSVKDDKGDNHLMYFQTLKDYLFWQMQLSNFTKEEEVIATAIIDAIDDDGYLTVDLEDIYETVNSITLVSLEAIEVVLEKIQGFDPVGVGARNYRENLLIQLTQGPQKTTLNEAAVDIIKNNLSSLAKEDFNKLKKVYDLSEEALKKIKLLVQSLPQSPIAFCSDLLTQYVIPDVIVQRIDKQWKVFLNTEITRLPRVNLQYAEHLKNNICFTDQKYLKSQLREARWLVKSVEKRNQTILKVTRYLVKCQVDFLENGSLYLKPLTLKEVAQALNLHESTVSRVTTGKYLLTPQGAIELKYFFSKSLMLSDKNLSSATAIQFKIKMLIENEDLCAPLSDQKIKDILSKEKINLSRRAVTKYREKLGIPSSTKRRLS